MSEKPPSGKKKTAPKKKKSSRSSSPTTPKSSDHSSSKPIEPKPTLQRLCPIHKKQLNFYSDIKETLICEDCAGSSEHLHYASRVLKIEEAFRLKASGLYNALNSFIMPKKFEIEQQKYKLDACYAALKANKNRIEHDMKGEFSAMNERLNFCVGTKQAVIYNDLKELQVDLDRIHHIINIIDSSSNDQTSFLQRSKDLKALIDLTLSKPLRGAAEIDYRDLPKELEKVREIYIQYLSTQNLIKIKDEIIWKLINEKPTPKEIHQATQNELTEWARLTEKYKQELKKFQIYCEYCECALNEETVNTICPNNIETEQTSNSHLQGTGRHYFSDESNKKII
jgi:hypothetical protein